MSSSRKTSSDLFVGIFLVFHWSDASHRGRKKWDKTTLRYRWVKNRSSSSSWNCRPSFSIRNFDVFFSSAPINTLTMSPEKRHEFQLARQRELVKRLKSSIYHWQPLSFDEYRSKIYLATNFASHYSMLVQIFNEVRLWKEKKKLFFSLNEIRRFFFKDKTTRKILSTCSFVRFRLGRWFSDVVKAKFPRHFSFDRTFSGPRYTSGANEHLPRFSTSINLAKWINFLN